MNEVRKVDAETMIATFVALREKRDTLRHEYQAADALLEASQSKVKQWLMKTMEAVGSGQLKGAAGIAYREIKRKYSCGDWPNFWAYIKANDRFDMIQKRVGEKAVSDLLDETGELPPGINIFQEYDIVIRRS